MRNCHLTVRQQKEVPPVKPISIQHTCPGSGVGEAGKTTSTVSVYLFVCQSVGSFQDFTQNQISPAVLW